MMELRIPGREPLTIQHLVLDYNGTLAVDGQLAPGVAERLTALAEHLTIHVITADTFGSAAQQTADLPVTLQIIGQGDQSAAKAALVESLGAAHVVALGNGANDGLMLKKAALSICVLGTEGCATATLMAADITVHRPVDGLDLLAKPGRLTATLRI